MKIRNILENIIIVAILLVIVQTFLHELALALHWNLSLRKILIFSGFFFDLLFTIEFIVRTILSARKKSVRKYWLYERGWVDFLSSIPLLVFDSSPTVYFILTGGMQESSALGALNVLKVVKAVRVTRILRLVRVIKIFGKIHNANSKMAQHHTATIATIIVFTIVLSLMSFSVFSDTTGMKKANARGDSYKELLISAYTIGSKGKLSNDQVLLELIKKNDNILYVKYKKKNIFSKIDDVEFKKYYYHDDYIVVKHGDFTITASIVDIHKDLAIDNMKSFFIIIFSVLSIMFIYTKHFAQNISDVMHILNKGFRKKDYNLQIKVRDEFADEEVFRVAKFYNDKFLPAKHRQLQREEEKKSSGLSMNDLMNFDK